MASPDAQDAGYSALLKEVVQRSQKAVMAAAAEQVRQEKILAAQRMPALAGMLAMITVATVILAFRTVYLRNQDLARRAADQAQDASQCPNPQSPPPQSQQRSHPCPRWTTPTP